MRRKKILLLPEYLRRIIDKWDKADFYFEMEAIGGYTAKGFWEDDSTNTPHLADCGKNRLRRQ
jgi:hypothetical protein